jgi:hypothetical protein
LPIAHHGMRSLTIFPSIRKDGHNS